MFTMCHRETCLKKKNADDYQIFKSCFVTPYDYTILQHSPFTKPLAVSSYLKRIIYKLPGPKHPVTSKIATGKPLKNNHHDGLESLEPQHGGLGMTWSLPNYKLQDSKTNSSSADKQAINRTGPLESCHVFSTSRWVFWICWTSKNAKNMAHRFPK